MGHVIVEPRKVDELVQTSIQQARIRSDEYNNSLLHSCTHGNMEEISARTRGHAALSYDELALKLSSEADIPYCPCGNLAIYAPTALGEQQFSMRDSKQFVAILVSFSVPLQMIG